MSKFNELLEEYATVRAYLEDREQELKPIKDAVDNIKAALQAEMNQLQISSAKSAAGHAVNLVTSKTVKVVDREAWMDFVFESGDDSFITNHVSKDAVAAYVDKQLDVPPGLAMEQVTTIRFTRAKG